MDRAPHSFDKDQTRVHGAFEAVATGQRLASDGIKRRQHIIILRLLAIGIEMSRNSLAMAHICTPPTDDHSWTPVGSSWPAVAHDGYVCPECDQHWARHFAVATNS